jgi:hypothetical protein
MSKKISVPPPSTPQADDADHSHPILPLIMVAVLVLVLAAVMLKAFGIV